MTSTEKRSRHDRFVIMSKMIEKRFPSEKIKGRTFYKNNDGSYFILEEFPGENALVIEYADNKDEAAKNMLEDGDRFYCNELSVDQMFNSMLNEIAF